MSAPVPDCPQCGQPVHPPVSRDCANCPHSEASHHRTEGGRLTYCMTFRTRQCPCPGFSAEVTPLSPAARLAPLQGSAAERKGRYAILRDGGASPLDAAEQVGIAPSTAKAYEQQYRKERGLPPGRGLAGPSAAVAETSRTQRILARPFAFDAGDEELIGPLPEGIKARQREHALACTASAAARSMPGIRAAVAFVGGRQVARFGADIADRRLLLEACGLLPYEAVRLPVKGCEGRGKTPAVSAGEGKSAAGMAGKTRGSAA